MARVATSTLPLTTRALTVRPSTGAPTPPAIDTAAHRPWRAFVMRRADVHAAIPNISSTNPPVSQPLRSTSTMTRLTAAS